MKEPSSPNLCKAGSAIPSIIGSDQGWFFIRRIVTHLGSCSVYDVRDDWRPKLGVVAGDAGKVFFTKGYTHQIFSEPQKRRGGKKAK